MNAMFAPPTSIRPRHAVDLGHALEAATPKPPKPAVPVATDIALRLRSPNGGEVPLSYWDVWYALLASDRFEGDLNLLATELRESRGGMFGSDAAERKLSHLRDLQQRLATAGICLADVLAAIPPEMAKAESRRAHGRIIKHNQRSYELSEAMRTLPSERFCDMALRGLWAPFPVSPETYHKRFRAKFNWTRFHGENASWGLAKKLDAATESASKLESDGKYAEAVAALRAILTVTIELVAIADDSFGCIGQSFQDAFERYLAFPRQKAGISSEGFLTDLLELLIFEDYGFTDDPTDGFFATLTGEEGDFCLAYLRGRIPALMAWDLDYQAEEALTLIGQVAAEQKRFDSFEALAAEMKSRHWQRIIRLADAAVKARQRDLADRVFHAALMPEDGGHRDFLSKKHEQLLNGKWSPDPRQ
jgi:hypothetical protein